MKKRTVFIGAILSLIPLGQPLVIGRGAALISSAVIHSLSANAESKDAYFFNERGENKLDDGDYKGAISDFTKAIKINPYKDPYTLHNRGYAKLNLKDYKGAISDFTEALKINPKSGDAYYDRGYAKLNLKDYEGAISDFTEVIKINPKDGDAYYDRGYAKIDLEDYIGAISDFTEVIKINPKDVHAYEERSDAKFALKDYEGAVFDKNKSLELHGKEKVQLSIVDIISRKMLKRRTLLWKAYNKFARFNGETYEKPITYYIHDENTKNASKYLPKAMRNSYEMSNDEEQFIVDFFTYIDSYIDLDFKRVDSKGKAMIVIYKTPRDGDINGYMTEPTDLKQYQIELAWAEGKYSYPKMKNYPTLSTDSAYTITHEIGHALGLEHKDPGSKGLTDWNMDPDDLKISSKDTVMSYNVFLYPGTLDVFYTELDIKALQKIWGLEKNN